MLENVDLTQTLSETEYKTKRVNYQLALSLLAFQVYQQQRPVIIVYEGWDAAGKGGNIKRVTQAIDPRGYTVYQIAAPKGEEATHHYLWRFWRHIPAQGEIAIFDRSWYGRVLVERVEGFCTEAEWKRAYREINEFERDLIEFGTIIFKFWIHISPEEQLRRFEARAQDPLKSWKLTEEDWRNREKWEEYRLAVNEMLLKTSTTAAPWHVIAGNSKPFARVDVLKILVESLSQQLAYNPYEADIFKRLAKKKKLKNQKKPPDKDK